VSILLLITEYKELFEYFKKKLSQSLTPAKQGADKEKQDLVIFSIMLLTSRLVPYSFATNDETEEEKILKCQPVMD